ncbi:glucose 1-dehydrogenase [Chitinophaga sancti]|uniref:3-oxoacyl-[acyl-carrier protein] reductase n=1 Tax=Chitinophaga sancti TaxID=1004 RepID=A0A1K1RN31_9BACT|nr:glucose 1-dehydrogenase [Chitinophaga sancti]WQD62592.1 glucose 1-dehydrogenase [Chitinophaga sancti]WQG91839.1 glucose 1-dehydrogenase [Chitinophaga sancti]SFW73683.1 3-oxoacyl-[acyl-carrier protein] reductase [Chitinophaga sancti]
MEQTLKGKVALVTGASKGIGAAIAKELAAAGAAVVVNYATSTTDAERVVHAITTQGGKAIALQANVSDAEAVKRMFTAAKDAFGQIDILVNNAGIYKFAPIEAVTTDFYREQFDINVLGPVLTIQEALKYFPATGGNIVNISSSASENPMPSTSIYAASKAALDALSVALARELGARNIRVNTIAAGPTITEGVKSQGMLGTEAEQFMIRATPLGRLGQPEDIAAIVSFLVSDAAKWITADRIKASGGLQ